MKYPSIQQFCADAGYRKTFERDIPRGLGLGVDISARIKPKWEASQNAGLSNALWLDLTIPDVFLKAMKHLLVPLKRCTQILACACKAQYQDVIRFHWVGQ